MKYNLKMEFRTTTNEMEVLLKLVTDEVFKFEHEDAYLCCKNQSSIDTYYREKEQHCENYLEIIQNLRRNIKSAIQKKQMEL